jgi:hypothetical protein
MYSARYDLIQNNLCSITDGRLSIPINVANTDYQAVLDAIIAEGAACFDGDIPAELQAAADAKLASGVYNADGI